MKKVLFATTAMFAVAAISTSSNAADPIKLSVGGFANAYVGYADQETNGTNDFASVLVQQDTELYFRGETKLDNGLTIGVNIDLEADSNATTQDDVFVSVSSDSLGKIYLGSTSGAGAKMHNVAPNVGQAIGDSENWISETIGTAANFGGNTEADGSDGQKIVYLTPNLGGFQLGASYGLVPESPSGAVNVGGTNTANDISYQAGIAYNGDFGGVSIAADVSGELVDNGGTNGTSVNNETTVRGGLNVGVAGFTIGSSYYRTQNVAAVSNQNSDGWDFGVSYETGPYGVSATIQSLNMDDGGSSAKQEDQKDYWTVSGSYDLGAGVTMIGSVFGVDFDDASATAANNTSDNEGFGIMTGLKVSF
ncbi:porin [Terasakiella sp. A23]|uniref:porin n=1 Tax=Terasakiella sp. FCG-A23 TaxID=3080561 RepID=UPI002954734B|nr:porin [Terasakiella sp. A23]MDV7341090.1 porin [Terasakiella sp. A23]